MGDKIKGGLTLIEAIIYISIVVILLGVSASGFFTFKKESDLNNNIQEFVNVLRTAQNKAASSENNDNYGVYIDASTLPNQYILFKGSDFTLRDKNFDVTHYLQSNLEFYNINIFGGGNEIIFNKISGATSHVGSISLRFKNDILKNKTIYISPAGTISYTNFPTNLDENRIIDSRHIKLSYNRQIDTSTENILLTFDGLKTSIVQIDLNISGGEIQWQDNIDVNGAIQSVAINTINLNNGTQINVYRDRRYNNKSLDIKFSNDLTGDFIKFSADGEIISSTSAYASNLTKQ